MEFDTRRLIIKKFIPEYIGIMYETWGNDIDTLKFLPEIKTDMTIDDFAEYIMKTFKNNLYTRSVIQNKDSHDIIGSISLFQEDSRSKSVVIIITKDNWNKGYGTEVLKGVIKFLKKQKVECIYATCDGRNIGATKMCEKSGFELIDTIEDYREDCNHNIGSEYLYELEL